jgi:hypothetical protein
MLKSRSLVVSQYRVVHRPVKELIEHLLDFQFAQDLKNIVDKTLSLQKMPQVVTADNQRPHQLIQSHSLGSSPHRNGSEPLLDFVLLTFPVAILPT